jgi:hypothetical protein
MILGKGEVWRPIIHEKSTYIFRVVRHHQKNIIEVFLVRYNNFEQFCSEYVLLHLTQLFKNLNFSENFFETIKSFENIIYDFDGNNLFSHFVLSLENLAKGALTDLVLDFVVFSDGRPTVW